MDQLTFIRVDDSGHHAVVADPSGREYLLALDSTLAAALHGRSHRVAAEPSSATVTPRDVQAMIRAGASTQQVADASGWSTDKISRYEAPILAEREHVAALARAVHLPSFGRGPSPTLEKRAKERLVMRGLRPDDAWWDAWRQDGNPWAVSLTFEAGGRQRRAVWHFDVLSSSLTPQDDEARWLSTAEEDGYADGQDASSSQHHAAATPPDQAATEPSATGADEAPLQDTEDSAADAAASPAQPAPAHEQEASAAGQASPPGTAHDSEAPEQAPIAPQQRRSRERRGRPSVPSWDDIMFGGSKN